MSQGAAADKSEAGATRVESEQVKSEQVRESHVQSKRSARSGRGEAVWGKEEG